jgi:hypothetical protein
LGIANNKRERRILYKKVEEVSSIHKHKKITIFLFVIFAIPLLPSLITLPFTAISLPLSLIGMMHVLNAGQLIGSLAFILTMLLAATYLATYIISLSVTIKNKAISMTSFFPFFQIVLFAIFLHVTELMQDMYGTQF